MTGRWLVTGGQGMLGRAVGGVLDNRSVDVTVAGRELLDITDLPAVEAAVAAHTGVINTAAWTDVDAAETHPDEAYAVNATAAAHLAAVCEAARVPLIHLSTDYVFSGSALIPYRENGRTGPINTYGATKLAGEQAVLKDAPTCGHVVRTAWLYGAGGRNFVTTVLRLAEQQDRIEVVDDQWGQPTWTVPLAERLADLAAAAESGKTTPGVLHAASSGSTTWCRLARAVFAEQGLDPRRIRAVTTEEHPRPAPRPTYSVLSLHRWRKSGMTLLGHWRPMLTAALETIHTETSGGTA